MNNLATADFKATEESVLCENKGSETAQLQSLEHIQS